MTGLVLLVLYGISSQGHASQAPWPALQIAADLTHLSAVAVWMAGLAIVAVMLHRLPRIAPVSGARLAAAVLRRFSAVALISVAVVVLTGAVRSVGQLSDPAQLWQTDYGQSVLIKLGLLSVIVLIAMWNRRVTNSISLRAEPPRAALTLVRRAAVIEFALALTVVLVAALLVAQVPGRV
jgi:copper transport protein